MPARPAGPEPPPAARAVFGDRVVLAESYVRLLATDGVDRGVIGPREVPRLWDRHLLNCAVLAELLPAGTRLVDVGSGAGLPGIALALARPDLDITLLDPSARRCTFLTGVLERLSLPGVCVVRGRAEEAHREPVDVATARAVAPLGRLVTWCLPLVAVGGRLLAVKGSSAEEEIRGATGEVAVAGGDRPVLRRCGVGVVEPPTTVVEITRLAARSRPRRTRRP